MTSDDALYALPWTTSSPEDCYFYYSMEIPGLGLVERDLDLRGGEDAYLGHAALAGRRILEIGPANGFLTFDMEAGLRWSLSKSRLTPTGTWSRKQTSISSGAVASRTRSCRGSAAASGLRARGLEARHRWTTRRRTTPSRARPVRSCGEGVQFACTCAICCEPSRGAPGSPTTSSSRTATSQSWPEVPLRAWPRPPSRGSGEPGGISVPTSSCVFFACWDTQTTVPFHTQRFTRTDEVDEVALIPMFTVVARLRIATGDMPVQVGDLSPVRARLRLG